MYALETTLHRLSVRRFHAEFYIRPDRRPAACALGKSPRDDPGFYFAQYHRFADLPCGRRSLTVLRRRALFADKNQNAGHERQDAHHDCWDGNVEEHGDSNKDEIDREQEHSEVFGDIHASFLRQTRRLCTLKDIPHDQIVMVNCQFGRRGRIGCQAAPGSPFARLAAWRPSQPSWPTSNCASFSQTDNRRTLPHDHRPEARFENPDGFSSKAEHKSFIAGSISN